MVNGIRDEMRRKKSKIKMKDRDDEKDKDWKDWKCVSKKKLFFTSI